MVKGGCLPSSGLPIFLLSLFAFFLPISLSLSFSSILTGEISSLPPPTSRIPRRRGIDEGGTRGKSPNRIPRRGRTFNGLETIYPFRSRVATVAADSRRGMRTRSEPVIVARHIWGTERTSPSSCHRVWWILRTLVKLSHRNSTLSL